MIAFVWSYEIDGASGARLKCSFINEEILAWSSEVKLAKLFTLIFESSGTLSSKVPSPASSLACDSTKPLTASLRLLCDLLSAAVASV